MGTFGSDLAQFEAKTAGKLDLAVRGIALELFSRVILRTPVDTGRARGNWQVQIGSIPNGTLALDDRSGTATVSKAQAAASGMDAGDVIYLTNNLPYARRLEEGYSAQAPAGMVALSVQEFQAIAAEIGIELVRI
ncbi:MAG: hypothetical protein ACPG61_07255 [Paracoccaceae bacterium]